MTFATFQVFEVIRLLTILQLFDDFSAAPLPPPSTSSYLTITWAALVDESVDALVLSLEVSVHYYDHYHHRHTTAITTNPDFALPGSCCRLNTP